MSLEIRGAVARSMDSVPEVMESVISTSIPTLDAFMRGLHPSKMTLIDSADRMVFDLTHIFCVNAIDQLHQEVVWVDGGNSINPYELSRICKRFGVDRENVLDNINVARAFTVYQLVSLIDAMLEEELERTGAQMVIVSCLPDLFQDPDVRWAESFQLMKRCVSKIQSLTKERGLITLITNYGLSKMLAKKSLKNLMYNSADQILRVENARGSLCLNLVNEGRTTLYHSVPHNQMTIEEFREMGYWEEQCLLSE